MFVDLCKCWFIRIRVVDWFGYFGEFWLKLVSGIMLVGFEINVNVVLIGLEMIGVFV